MLDNIFVSVVPSKKVRGLSVVETGDGDGLGYDGSPVKVRMEAITVKDLLETHFDSDAHFSCYTADNGGRYDDFPRIRKEALGQLAEVGTEVKCAVVVLDLDLKDQLKKRARWSWHDVEAPSELRAEILKLAEGLDWSVFYTTLHGCRFVHVLALDVPAGGGYEELVLKFHEKYRAAGLRIDGSCKDWTRLFRAPMVTREDGIETWDEPWFDMRVQEENFYIPEEKELVTKKETVRKRRTVAVADDRPEDDEAADLLWGWDDGKRGLTEEGKKLEACLRGTAIHCYVFGGTPFAREGNRHDKLCKLAGILVAVVRRAEWGSIELCYAAVREACLLLDDDEDWTGKAWEMVSSFWNRDGMEVAEEEEEDKGGGTETAELALNEKGVPYNTRKNFWAAVTASGVDVWYDEFTDSYWIDWEGRVTPINELALRQTRQKIEDELGFQRVPFVLWEDAIFGLAFNNSRHPVKDYFGSLEWDGISRLDGLLRDYFGAGDQEIYREFGRIHMTAAVSRIYEPGKKYDQALVLEAPQGFYKSSAIRALCPKADWYVDDLQLGADSKLIIEQSVGKIFVEFAELTGMRKSDIEKIKSSLSRQVDRARKSYGRVAEDHRRKFVFWGTTNDAEYLSDRTGNRRFWPVVCGKIDIDKIKADRDQLWAEAVVRYQRGDSIYLDPKYYEQQNEMQAERLSDDDVSFKVKKWLEGVKPEDFMVKSTDLYSWLELNHVSAAKLGIVMAELGFQSYRMGRARIRVYFIGKRSEAVWVSRNGNALYGNALYQKLKTIE